MVLLVKKSGFLVDDVLVGDTITCVSNQYEHGQPGYQEQIKKVVPTGAYNADTEIPVHDMTEFLADGEWKVIRIQGDR